MTSERRDADDERALDPGESWGQGPDASHPETAADDALPADRGSDPSLGVDDADDIEGAGEPPLT